VNACESKRKGKVAATEDIAYTQEVGYREIEMLKVVFCIWCAEIIGEEAYS
jgi:translation initiation factor IF-2